MNRPKKQLNFQRSILALLAIYAIFTADPYFVSNLSNFFSAFSTSLINFAPDEVSRYELHFYAINGDQFAEPLSSKQSDVWHADKSERQVQSLINQLGIAVQTGNLEKADLLHAELTDDYFREVMSAEYDLILRVVNPVERYSTNEWIAEQLISRYTFTREQAISLVQTLDNHY